MDSDLLVSLKRFNLHRRVTKVEYPFREYPSMSINLRMSDMLYRFHLYYVNARTICALLNILSNVQTHLHYGLIHVKSVFCTLS